MKRKQVAKGLLAGAAVGVAVGLLFAPNSGKKTRQALVSKSRSAKSRVGKYFPVFRHKTPQGPEFDNGAHNLDDHSKENVESR